MQTPHASQPIVEAYAFLDSLFLLDPTCILLPPKSKKRPVGHLGRIAAALATRYRKDSVSCVRKELDRAVIEEWGKVRRVDSDEGDTMVCASMRSARTDDSRDATFIRVRGGATPFYNPMANEALHQYEALVDRNARHRHQPMELMKETAYGQLTHIFVVKFTAESSYLGIAEPETVIFAAIRTCKLEADDPQLKGLDVHFYSQLGGLDLVDIVNLQALVARCDGGLASAWAIFDRSGDLARAEFDHGE